MDKALPNHSNMNSLNFPGEHSNRGELGRLLQLILGCAVNCTEKQEYIQRIMSMEESVQHVVMTAIQEVCFYTNCCKFLKHLNTRKKT